MRFYDITMQIEPNMTVYKNKEEKKPVFESVKGSTNETVLKFNLHTGTHIDFAKHVYDDGKTSTNFQLDKLITLVKVFDLTDVSEKIKKEHLENFEINSGDFVLLKTKNSFENVFNFEFVYLEESGAKFLADKKVAGVGIDALGIERNSKEHKTHKILFDANVLILEGINLSSVSQSTYQMIAMPLKIADVDALPVSAILVDIE